MPGTTYNQKYDRSRVLDTVEHPIDGPVVDPLSQVILDMCAAVTTYDEYFYREGDRFTTLVYNVYGTTTIGWFVLYYNGVMSPLELVGGMLLRFPNLSEIEIGMLQRFNAPSGRKVII